MNTSVVKSTVLGLLLSTSVAFAQNEGETDKNYRVETNKFFDNWFVGAGVGGNVYFGDHDSHRSFGKRIAPIYNLNVGKWFTPGLGLRFNVGYSYGKGLTTNNSSWYTRMYNTGGTLTDGGVTYYKQKIRYGYVNANIMFNLSNMLAGYSPNRFYNLIPYAGAGVMRSVDKAGGSHEHELTAVAGILNKFRLSNAFDLTLDLQGSLFGRAFSHKRDLSVDNSSGRDHTVAALLGVVYKFKQRDWNPVRPNNEDALNAEINSLRERVGDLSQANEALNAQLASKPRVVTEKEVVTVPGTTIVPVVAFKINSSKIEYTQDANIYNIAKYLRDNSSVKVVISGYADKKTGTTSINQRLSERRANAVRDVLVKKYGIAPGRVSVDAKGDKVQPFESNEWNRVVLFTIDE